MYNTSAEPTKSKATAAVLAGLLGIFGAHRFYLKRIGSAVTQLILGGICMIVGVICVSSALKEVAYSYGSYRIYYRTETVIADEGLFWFGIVQLCVSAGIGVWVLVDFIRILTGSLLPADGSLYAGQQPRSQGAYQSRIAVPYRSNLDYSRSPSDSYTEVSDTSKERLSGDGISKPASQTDDAITKLERLAKLRDGGYISEEEFQQKKQDIISRM